MKTHFLTRYETCKPNTPTQPKPTMWVGFYKRDGLGWIEKN